MTPCAASGSPGSTGMNDVAQRSAFLVDTDGTVRGAWAYEDGDVPDVDELLAAARALSGSS